MEELTGSGVKKQGRRTDLKKASKKISSNKELTKIKKNNIE